jgi:hypothetical protein
MHILIMETPLAIFQFTVEQAHLHSMVADIPKSFREKQIYMACEEIMAQILST